MAGKHRKEEFKAYPKYKALYKKLADEIEKIGLNEFRKELNGKTYPTLFDWWINV